MIDGRKRRFTVPQYYYVIFAEKFGKITQDSSEDIHLLYRLSKRMSPCLRIKTLVLCQIQPDICGSQEPIKC